MESDEGTLRKAEELGRLVGQTTEYKALVRARERIESDEDVSSAVRKLAGLEEQLASALRQGETPDEDTARDYEEAFGELQAHPAYQGLVAAQANFDKVMAAVNTAIARGMDSGARSGIILPS
ncbi:MAG TPA: YlbF family regulator [Longimicrobiales bacterium]|nr:YlbF family regulator [Longimicrobiales bacterium]